jgi:hypothetical protein
LPPTKIRVGWIKARSQLEKSPVVRFACPSCEKVLKAPDTKAGTVVRCPSCGQAVEVPIPPKPTSQPRPGVLLPDPAPAPPSEPDASATYIQYPHATSGQSHTSKATTEPADDYQQDDSSYHYTPSYEDYPRQSSSSGLLAALGVVVSVFILAMVVVAVGLVTSPTPGLGFLLLMVAVFALLVLLSDVLMLAWVVKDARSRGIEGGIWVVVILMANMLGLLVYLASRPAGSLIPCHHCGYNRLDYAKRYPHCHGD